MTIWKQKCQRSNREPQYWQYITKYQV